MLVSFLERRKKLKRQYIGICDFSDCSQVQAMLNVFEKHNYYPMRRLMSGLMMSYKTMNGIPTKWADVFPKKEKIKDIFFPNFNLLNTLHYVDYEGIDVEDSLFKATGYGGQYMNAIQLDMIWPDPKVVKKYHDFLPLIEVVLQVGSNALDAAGNDPKKVLKLIDKYGEALDYVLFDKSMGKGLGMDAKFLFPFVDLLYKQRPNIGLAVAGGLGPETLHLAGPLLKKFPRLSTDAQSRLRKSGSSLDPIDWPLAEEYLIRHLGFLNCLPC